MVKGKARNVKGVLSGPTHGICHKYTILEKVEITYHGKSWKRIAFGYNKQVRLKSLTFLNGICRILMDRDGQIEHIVSESKKVS